LRLAQLVDVLEELVPLSWAEPWDNVGLLVQPRVVAEVASVLLTVDLTRAVVQEARRRRADMVVAYHPPLFEPLRRLLGTVASHDNVMQCIAAGIAIYSPHTALDAAPGGVNDWLADGLGSGERSGLMPQSDDADGPAQGREIVLDRPVALATLIRRVKQHLGLERLRVAAAKRHDKTDVRRVALCAGAGGSVLGGRDADVYLTGEMRHHDVLAAVERGTTVVLCEHTNTERGYLPVFAQQLRTRLGRGVKVTIAGADAEPLRIR